VLVFAVLYGLTAAGSFVLVEAVRRSDPVWDGSVRGLAGLSRRSPHLALSLVVIMLSLTGIPLTAGFWGKFLVFAGASIGGYLWLAVAGMLGSVVSFGYYGRAIRSAYMAEPETSTAQAVEPDPSGASAGGAATAVTVGIAAAIVLVGVAPLIWGLAPVMRVVAR
jgi:NADH-quinone oxidoreductase subunit N